VNSVDLSETGEKYLRRLCLEIPTRRVGSEGNRNATDFWAEVVASFGFQIESPSFDCIDWTQNGAQLAVGGEPFEVFVSPYSLGCRVAGLLTVVSTVEELEALNIDNKDKIVLLRGEIAREQLMPKDFPFYNPDEHKRIVHLLETKKPLAIVAATSRDPALAGGVYPFPLIEDGDFDIPSVYMTDREGDRLATHAGSRVLLEIKAERIPASGCNVIARKGADPNHRVVLFAHIDAKDNTPGAIDNAAGAVVLLLLAELLADYSGSLGLEMVALNGEDYYNAPGEQQYVRLNAGRFAEIILGVNIDAAGYVQGGTAFSLYDCPVDLADLVRQAFAAQPDMVEGEPWYQSDHGLFIQHHRPALAITSERFMELTTYITHTPKDRPEIVDMNKLVLIAMALRDLLLSLNRYLS
jgi:aminopeptidase YwaD